MEKTSISLSNLNNDKNIVILAADKESCQVILDKTDYDNKTTNTINKDNADGKYIITVGNNQKDLKCL